MSTPPTLARFEALIDQHRASAPDANGLDISERDPQSRQDRAALGRVYDRTTMAEQLRDAGVIGAGQDLSAALAHKWAAIDAADLRHVKGQEYREDVVDHFNNNRHMSSRYDVTLQAEHRSTYAEATDYERRQAALISAKEDRKILDAQSMGIWPPPGRNDAGRSDATHPVADGLGEILVDITRQARDPRSATRGAAPMSETIETRPDSTASSIAASVREEDRARMEAYTSMKRQEALQKFPELQRAYDLQDASNAFRAQNIPDASASAQFQKMTDEYIRQKLTRGEVLPEIKQRSQDQERDRKKERERAVEPARVPEQELDR